MTATATAEPPEVDSSSRADGGFSLLEISVAVMLLGLSGVLIIGGLFAVVRSSRVNFEQARVEAVLSNAAERLNEWGYIACPPSSGSGSYLEVVQSAAGLVGWPPSTVSIVGMTYFDPTAGGSNPWTSSNSSSGGCNPTLSSTSPRTLQKVVVRVGTPSGSYFRQLEVVKNNVATGTD